MVSPKILQMDDDSSLDTDDLDDEAHIPMTTATPTVEMDREGGDHATAGENTNTCVLTIFD